MTQRRTRSAAALDQETTPPRGRRRSDRISQGSTSVSAQSSSSQQAIDANPRSRSRKGKRKQPPDGSQSAGSSKRATTGSGVRTVRVGEPRPNDPTNLNQLKCFRISGLPSSWSENDLFEALHAIDPSLTRQNYRPSLYPACYNSTQIALLNLDPSTEHLQRHKHLQVSESASRTAALLTIDSQFYNLTPLNVPVGEVVADVIAVTGLAGHAFGSWRNRETHQMWLKDLLPHDVQNIRIMLYGYDSRLIRQGKTESRLLDYQRLLIQDIENARGSVKNNRPIIFIGHSLGGILILQALIESRRNPSHRHILDSTYSIIFFGTPHQGMRTYDLEEMVDAESGGYETSKHNLLRQLREGSEFLENHKEELNFFWEEYKPKIVSFYETAPTPTVERSESGSYERDGNESEMVKRFSAQLYIPTEQRVPVEENHMNMVKFASAEDRTYRTVARYLKEWVDSITESNEAAIKIQNLRKSQECSPENWGWGPEKELLQIPHSRTTTFRSTIPDSRFCRIEGWRIPDYFSSVDNDLSNAITITRVGQTQYIAKTAGAFLHTEFPWASRHLLETLCDLCGEITKTKKTYMNKVVQQMRWLDIKDETHYSRLCLHIKASYSFLEVSTEGAGIIAIRFGEIVQALHWIVAAIVPRNIWNGLYGSRLRALCGNTPWITTLELTQLATPPQNSCWTHMFQFACVVNDEQRFYHYPKCFLDPGLTLDFNLLVELAAVEREVLSTEGVFLLGFDTALIPLKPLGGKRWHFVYKPGKQMTSRDISSLELPRLAGKQYQQGIVSVGWCAASVIIMGTRKDDVNTKESKIDMALEKKVKAETTRAIQFQFAVQGGIGGSALTGTIGYQRQITHKQGAVVAIRSPADNYRRILTQASSTRVILFDNGTKRAWLVPAVVVLLYACLCLIENEKYQLFEEESGKTKPFTYASESHNAEKSSVEALRCNQDMFMRRTSSDKPEAFSELVKDVWHDMARGENICKNDASGHLLYENNWVFGYDLTEAILGKDIHLRGFKADVTTANWAILTEVIPVIFVADVGQVIQTKECSISCKDLSGAEGLLSCTVHDLLAVSQVICHKQWNLLGNPWAASSSCSNTSAGPCVYCSELQRIQTICHPHNNRSFLERIGRGRKVAVEKRQPDALTEAAFQAMMHHQQGAVRFGTHS